MYKERGEDERDQSFMKGLPAEAGRLLASLEARIAELRLLTPEATETIADLEDTLKRIRAEIGR